MAALTSKTLEPMAFGIDVFVDCMTCEIHFGPMDNGTIFSTKKNVFCKKVSYDLYIALQMFGISMIFFKEAFFLSLFLK